jgi:predicted esterase
MNRSMMIYRERRPQGARSRPIVALHGLGGDVDQLGLLCLGADSRAHLFTPQAIRPVTPTERSYRARDPGYRWYFGDLGDPPEPATLGESLWQVEQFIADVRDSSKAARVLVIGVDQGAIVATLLARAIPEWLCGVVAIQGALAEIRGWSPPAQELSGLPLLLIYDPVYAALAAQVRDSASRFRELGARLSQVEAPGVGSHVLLASPHVHRWLEELRVS